MNSLPVQLGVGGIFVILLLQILLPWLLKAIGKNGNGNGNGKQVLKSGELDPAYWQREIATITEAAMQRGMLQLLKPSLDAQTDILREIRGSNAAISDGVRQLVIAREADERRGR